MGVPADQMPGMMGEDPMQPPTGMPALPGGDQFPPMDEEGMQAPRAEPDPEEDEHDTDTDYRDAEHLQEKLTKVYERIVKGWQDRKEHLDGCKRYWDCYNGILNENQAYSGESRIYDPIVHDAIEALTQRDTAMLFPENGRYTDCTAETGSNPRATMALMDHYLDRCQAQVQMSGVLRAGHITGQRNIGVEWKLEKFHRVELQPPKFSFIQKVISIFSKREKPTPQKVTEERGRPNFYPIATEQLMVLPVTVDRIEDADIVSESIIASEDWIDNEVRNGLFDEDVAEMLKEKLTKAVGKDGNNVAAGKERAEEAGVKDGGKYVLIYRAWALLDLEDGDDPEPAMIYYAGPGEANIACVRRNPYWCGKPPILSSPDRKVPGSFWGHSRVDAVENLQYMANDALNEGMDSAKRTLMQIILADPEKNPRYGSFVQAPGAVWEADPNSVQPITMTPLYQHALEIVDWCKSQIMESMGLNAAMVPSSRSGKVSQAQVAQEQQIALMQVNDDVTRFEREVLDPLLEWFYEMDQQFRDEDATIRVFGDLGRSAKMEKIPAEQRHERYFFRWIGTKAFQGAQKLQQKIAMMNVFRGIPPQQMGGRVLDIGPILDQMAEETFGPVTARQILKDPTEMLTVPPDDENEMLENSLPVTVHPLDNDVQHLQVHSRIAQNDPTGVVAVHIQAHQNQLQMKNMQRMAAKNQGAPGVPGGAGRGVPGTPRPGGQAQGPHSPAGPAGGIHPDQMADVSAPRNPGQ